MTTAGERGGGPAARHLPVSDDLQQESSRHARRREAGRAVRLRRRPADQGDRQRSRLPAQVLELLQQVDGVSQAFRRSVLKAIQLRLPRGTTSICMILPQLM